MRRSVPAAVVAALLLLWLAPAGQALAATFTVTTTADAHDGNAGDGICASTLPGTPCTLRAAVETANLLGGAHTIRLPAATYPLTVGTWQTGGGDLDILANITVRNVGGNLGDVTIDAGGNDRVFEVMPSGALTAIGLTLTNGAPGIESGGAILSKGQLTLIGVTVINNSSATVIPADGGGIKIDSGTATLYASTVSDNTATANGGGISIRNGVLTLIDSTVSGNTAQDTGGGIVSFGRLTAIDSTIANNTSTDGGGGIAVRSSATASLTRVTLSNNNAARGGGLFLFLTAGSAAPATATLSNVTISGNTATGPGGGIRLQTDGAGSGSGLATFANVTVGPNTAGSGAGLSLAQSGMPLTLDTSNTIYASSCATAGAPTVNTAGGNVRAPGTGCPGADASVLLQPLADNGGFTQTHALGAGSDAVNAGTGPGCPTPDQRGLPRSLGGPTCDAGAYELKTGGNGPPVISPIAAQYVEENSGPLGPIAFQVADSDTPRGAATLSVSISGNTSPAFSSFSFGGAGGSRTVTGTPDPNASGAGTVTVQVSDGSEAATSPFSIDAIDASAVNSPPANAVPGPQTTTVNTPKVFSTANGNAITGTDPDVGSGTLRMILSVTSGTLALPNNSGLAVTENGTATVTAYGSPATLNAGLQGLTFTPPGGFTGAITLTVTTSDQGNTGSGGPLQDQDTVPTDVGPTSAINHPPVNTVPSVQTTPVNTPILFSNGNGNTIRVTDPNPGNLQVMLSVTSGTLTLGSTSGLSVTGNGTATVTATGPLASLNAGLQGLTFAPPSGFTGAVTLTVTTNDLDNGGSGVPLVDQDTTQIVVTAPETPPPPPSSPPPTPPPSPPTSCAPRPRVTLQTAPTGDGRLRVTVVAGTDAANPTNRLSELRFEAGTNALVDVAGQTARPGPFTLPLPDRPASVTFFARRAAPGQPTTLPVTVVDDCGPWPTFVGGGAGAGF